MEQLAAALASLAKLQEEQQRRWEEAQRQAEERRQEEERRREEAQRQAEERRQEEERRREEAQRQAEERRREEERQREEQAEERRREEERQRERHYEEIQAMQEQHMQQIEIMKGVLAEREGNSPHLKISPYQETEDIQDFIEAFEGIMKIQGVNRTNWILRLTPLLSGKARTVCTDLGTTTDYDGVKKAILEHYNINTERCRRKFRSHVWTRDQDPTDWIARGVKLVKRWLVPENGMEQVVNKIAVEQLLNGLPHKMRIWVTSQNPETPEKVGELIESYNTAHSCLPQRNRPKKKHGRSKEFPRKTEGSTGNKKERKSPSEITCYKCNRKGHIARNCTEKTLRAKENAEEVIWHGEGNINGHNVKRIQIDSGASRTVVDRKDKTTQRILRRFYWPTLFKDVRLYCEACKDCQLHANHKRKAPMIPLPIIGEPFKRIAMDIVGLLPRTSRGNRFILVINDYATRYPEAFPLRNITAKKVAEVLIELFARYGIPEEILTDQGSNFTSSLLGELYHLMGVKAIKTSPYHPQTDGLVERFNRTLKSMLRKVLEGERKNWDHMIPYVLFAYREVPQSTLGFSPFELLYGREVRGPLDVLKEEWIHSTEIETDILSFVMDTRERMESAREIVKENARAVQAKQKMYYDQRSREINFEVGDKVLLLLPSSTRKFVAKWQGPYEVIRKIGKVTYEIEMPDKGGRKQIFHVNHLKKWKERAFVNAVIEDGEDIEGYRWSDTGEIVFGTQLTEDMKSDLWRVLRKFPRVGAILSQGEENLDEGPVAYFSKKLLPREQAYSTVEKECLAIILAIKHFSAYLIGRSFIIQTDHRALQWLHKFKEKNARLTRWSLILQPYNFTIQHRKGVANANADALSRLERKSTSCQRGREEIWFLSSVESRVD
uniref:Reverse transcriptase n=1 Tax=Amphimedon queenslandica TaxID=400682 RepID=A0A1X7U952_AMPQE